MYRPIRNQIPHYKQGEKLYFNKSEINEWLMTYRIETEEELHKIAVDYCLKKPLKY